MFFIILLQNYGNMFLSQLIYAKIFGGNEHHIRNLLSNCSEKIVYIFAFMCVYTHMRIGEERGRKKDDKANVIKMSIIGISEVRYI